MWTEYSIIVTLVIVKPFYIQKLEDVKFVVIGHRIVNLSVTKLALKLRWQYLLVQIQSVWSPIRTK